MRKNRSTGIFKTAKAAAAFCTAKLFSKISRGASGGTDTRQHQLLCKMLDQHAAANLCLATRPWLASRMSPYFRDSGVHMKFAKRAAVLLTSVSLAACSSIGTINGVEMNSPRMGATQSGPQPYCDQNDQQRWFCILAGAAIVGGLVAIVAAQNHHNTAAPVPVMD